MYNPSQPLTILPPELDKRCHLSNYGVDKDVIDILFRTIVRWLKEDSLPWTRTSYINLINGPQGRSVIELLFFHYNGPPEAEVGSGGELNYCKMYLYEGHVSINFLCEGDDPSALCSLSFKYSTKWYETDIGLMVFLVEYLNAYMKKVFEATPRRFDGTDNEMNTIMELASTMERTMAGDGLLG